MRDEEGLALSGTRRRQRHENVHPAFREILFRVDALVAHDLAAVRGLRFAEQPGGLDGRQERLQLLREPRPGGTVLRLEHCPARAALDAAHDGLAAAHPGQEPARRAATGSTGERAQRLGIAAGGAQRLDGVHAMSREAQALQLGQHPRRPRARPKQQLVVRARLPQGPLLVQPRERACDRAAVGESLVAPAQAVIGEYAWEAHQRVIAAELELAQARESLVAGFPVRGRIDDEHEMSVAAELRGHEQRAGPHFLLATQRRDAQEVDVLDVLQREQAAAPLRRADHVVVGERPAVVTVRRAVDVADRMARAGAESAVGTLRRQWLHDAHEGRILQRAAHAARSTLADRDATEDLLVLDVLGPVSAHTLHHEIEAVVLARTDVVVIDRRPQRLARARAECLEPQRRSGTAGKADGRRAAAVHQAQHYGFAPAVVEELLDGIGERARLPQPAEHLLEFAEAAQADRLVDRTPQTAADEGRRARLEARETVLGTDPLGYLDPPFNRGRQTDVLVRLP